MSDDLDRLIDGVARATTEGPPDAEFVRRVSVRMAEAEARGVQRDWSRGWLLAPAAAACALLLAVFVARETRAPQGADRLKEDTTRTAGAAKSASAGLAATAPAAASASVTVEPPAPTRSRPTPPTSSAPAGPGFERLAVAPIQVERVDVSPLARSERIDITPIAIDRIEIAAMP